MTPQRAYIEISKSPYAFICRGWSKMISAINLSPDDYRHIVIDPAFAACYGVATRSRSIKRKRVAMLQALKIFQRESGIEVIDKDGLKRADIYRLNQSLIAATKRLERVRLERIKVERLMEAREAMTSDQQQEVK